MKLKDICMKFAKKLGYNNKIESDDSYMYSKIVWNDRTNLIILLSFTKDYFDQIIELQDAINHTLQGLCSKIIYSSYEEDEKNDDDTFAITNRIIHNKYYMLIGGNPKSWQELYMKIHNLGNDALSRITKEIINNCHKDDFKQLVEDGILYDFKDSDKLKFDDPAYTDDGYYYTDPETILNRLPEGFTGRDIIKFITIIKGYKITNAYDEIINIRYMTDESFKSNKLYQLYASLINNPTPQKLALLLEPLYKQPDDDSIPGDVSDESLDELFRENYERFSAVADENTLYEDIDEILPDDEYEDNEDGDE